MTARTLRTEILQRGDDGSTATLSVLPGGLRVVTESMPFARSASVGVWVGVGSMDERRGVSGAAHFLEHLLFKGTRRHSGAEISTAIDSVGGELNAFTSHEYTCYYAYVMADQAALAVELVCDVVLNALLAPGDVETERQVILEEIAMREDDPEETLADAFAGAVFDGYPVSQPVIGTAESVEAMSRRQVAGFYHRRYRPDHMVISAAGRLEHADVLRWVRRAFGEHIRPGNPPVGPRGGAAGATGGVPLALVQRDIEQSHVCLGVRSLPRTDPRRYAQAVLSAAIGGGMSSRLFRTIREEYGLAYSCYSATSAYAATGSLSVYAGCNPDQLGRVVELIGKELAEVADSGLRPDELKRVRGQLVGSLLLSLEDAESRMSRIGKDILVRAHIRPVAEEIAALRGVTGGQVASLARDLLRRPMSAAVVGPYSGLSDLPAALTALPGHRAF